MRYNVRLQTGHGLGFIIDQNPLTSRPNSLYDLGFSTRPKVWPPDNKIVIGIGIEISNLIKKKAEEISIIWAVVMDKIWYRHAY